MNSARHQQQVEALCAASIRALAGERDLHFRAARLHRGRRALPLFAPHLLTSLADDDFGSFRGAADGLALRLLLADEALHHRLAPAAAVERLVFEMLEQYRVESLVPPTWVGVATNLRHRFEAWTLQCLHSEVVEGERGLLLFTLAQMAHARVTGWPPLDEAADLIEAPRAALAERIGNELAALRRARADQAAYATQALAIAAAFSRMLVGRDDGKAFFSEAMQALNAADEAERRGRFALLTTIEAPPLEGASAAKGQGRRPGAAGDDEPPYQAYTRAYDREVAATALARREQLKDLREQLDARIARQGVNLARLTRQLQLLLGTPRNEGWIDGQEEGRIDGARLAQLVASPAERRLFRHERELPVADCVVSLLIDCSGSMKQHIETVALWADVLARALEQAGAACEVLGFTTGAWNGGRVMRDWRRDGAPRRPGRLNETLHIVFKDAATPWRRARAGLAALLKADLFREGVDGEAVDWAATRLAQRDEARRVLIVISDGSPMDGATALANGELYLDHHLVEAVQRHESARQIEISALGVGLDLSPYYSRSRATDTAAASGHAVFDDLLALLAGRGWR